MRTFFHLTRKLVHEVFTLVGHAAVFAAVCATWLGKTEKSPKAKGSRRQAAAASGKQDGRFAELFTRLILVISICLSAATVCICLKKDGRN